MKTMSDAGKNTRYPKMVVCQNGKKHLVHCSKFVIVYRKENAWVCLISIHVCV